MSSPTLSPVPPESVEADGRSAAASFAAVAIEDSLDKLLDYSIPPRLAASLRVGQRVCVPLGRGNRRAFGYVIALRSQSDVPRIKPLLNIDDERVLLTGRLLELARWMSGYYVAPLGTVIESIIPSAVKKKIGMEYVQMVRLAMDRAAVQAIFEQTKRPKRRAILARLLQLEPEEAIDMVRLASEAGVKSPAVRSLAAIGIITIISEVDLPGLTAGMRPSSGAEADILLNEEQQKVFAAMKTRFGLDDVACPTRPSPEPSPSVLCEGQREVPPPFPSPNPSSSLSGRAEGRFLPSGPRLPTSDSRPSTLDPPHIGFSVNLLHGVTGSGKTEVYLQIIRQLVSRGRQAIVLVPEIALTPQTVRRFTARFTRVAVLHSGLTPGDRHRFWQLIASGQADVVVGARSAVFAPLPNLGLIVVDEEHDASYKQDSAPRYNGRDVAIKRAQIENVPVILGSATPSLEMYWKVTDEMARSSSVPGPAALSPYCLLSMPHRVRGLSMPQVELIDMKQEARFRRGVHLMSQRLEVLLRAAIDARHQAILLLNRRGYSSFVYCVSCQQAVQCKYCDATMTYHRSAAAGAQTGRTAEGVHTGQLHCHYCLAVTPLPPVCPQCGKLLSLFGLGTQRVEEELARKFPGVTMARVDSDTMRSGRDYEALLGRFGRGEIQVMLGTQMIAKGLDYPNVTLVGVINGDTALALPDFRSAERTFQLITQVAGRAGRGDSAGRVIVQTFLPDDPAIRSAIRQDFSGFANAELALRREVGLPPFGRICRIVLRDQDMEKLGRRAEELAADIAAAVVAAAVSVKMKGPMPCPIGRIAGFHRQQIILYAPRAQELQRVLAALRGHRHLSTCQRVAVDVDPVSLL